MPVRNLIDEHGESLKVLDVDGYYVPTFDSLFGDGDAQEKEFRTTPDWKGRQGDILICAYPKAGTHWVWEMTAMLVNGSADRIKQIKETAMIEGLTQQMYDNLDSPRILNSHLTFDWLPKDYVKLKNKIVYILRNPKDLAVSFYNHHYKILEYKYEGKWENYFHRFLKGAVDYGSWFDYTLQMEAFLRDNPELPVHVMFYEDMKENSVRELEKLCTFLEVKKDPDLIAKIAEKCDFHNMKKEKVPLEMHMADEWRDNQPGMYRKGQVGDWKNWFTVAQNEQFDDIYQERMKDFSLTFRYNL